MITFEKFNHDFFMWQSSEMKQIQLNLMIWGKLEHFDAFLRALLILNQYQILLMI